MGYLQQKYTSGQNYGGGGGGGEPAPDAEHEHEEAEEETIESEAVEAASQVLEGTAAVLEQAIKEGKIKSTDLIKIGDKVFEAGKVLNALKGAGLAGDALGVSIDIYNALQKGDNQAIGYIIADALIVAGVTAIVSAGASPVAGFAAGYAVEFALEKSGGTAVIVPRAVAGAGELARDLVTDKNGVTLFEALQDLPKMFPNPGDLFDPERQPENQH